MKFNITKYLTSDLAMLFYLVLCTCTAVIIANSSFMTIHQQFDVQSARIDLLSSEVKVQRNTIKGLQAELLELKTKNKNKSK